MKQCQKTLLILLLIFLFLGVAGYFINSQRQNRDDSRRLIDQESQRTAAEGEKEAEYGNEPTRMGGQKDEHGCLISAGYQWCPSTEKCQRMWEEYCEEFKDQFRGNNAQDQDELSGQQAGFDLVVGDAGENPPEYTQDWQAFTSEEGHFKFQYPDSYETVMDKYGWPYSVVHLANKAGGQSYDITFEVWDDEKQAADEGRMADPNAFFGMVENPFTENFVSITCWNEGTKQDCEDIYATLVMQE